MALLNRNRHELEADHAPMLCAARIIVRCAYLSIHLCAGASVNKNGNDQQQHGKQSRPVTKTRINRRFNRARQAGIDYTFGSKRKRADDAAERIDDRRDSIVRYTNEWQSFFDRAQAGLREMLVRARRSPEPRIVCHVEQPRRPRSF
jgi:hypothetical protein